MGQKIVIAGGSLAGASAAATLRQEGFDGEIIVLSSEESLPYERPPLSKSYLRGEVDRSTFNLHPASFYQDQDIDLRLGSWMTGILPSKKVVEVNWQQELSYDRLLLATGAAPRLIDDGTSDHLEDLYYLRTVDDCDQIKQRLPSASQAVIVGGGFIGCEVAASLCQLGLSVYLIDSSETIMSAPFGVEVGRFFQHMHEEEGVKLLLEDNVEEIIGNERVEGVITSSGNIINCDLLIVCIGVNPAEQVAAAAGILCRDGILTQANFQTSKADIFAVGDVARVFHPHYQKDLRVEHWFNARQQGRVVAPALLGRPVSYQEIPYFFSDQYDASVEYSGYSDNWDSVAVFGDRSARRFSAFWLRKRIIEAVITVNLDHHDLLRRQIGSPLSVEEIARHEVAAQVRSSGQRP